MSEKYTYRELPWISKSKIGSLRFCKHLFKLRYIDNYQMEASDRMKTGTNMHVVYASFFRNIDFAKLRKIPVRFDEDVKDSRLYEFMYKTLMEGPPYIPPKARDYELYVPMFENFLEIEVLHWKELYKEFGENIGKMIKYWVPAEVEKYKENKDLQIFGTVDRIDLSSNEEGVRIILDYKTGRVPKRIYEERDYDPTDEYCWWLPTKRNFELHFYLLLDMLNRGYRLNPKLIDYCTKEEYFTEDSEIPDTDWYLKDSKNREVKIKDLYRVGIIYTGVEKKPFVPKKRASTRSLLAVFRGINELRTILKNGGPYPKKVNYYVCKHCNEYVREQCLTEEENKMVFWDEYHKED